MKKENEKKEGELVFEMQVLKTPEEFTANFRSKSENLEQVLGIIRAISGVQERLWDYFQKQSEEIKKKEKK